MKCIAWVAGLGLCAALAGSAQESPRFAFSLGGGFTQPLGNTGRNLDSGWNLAAGGGANLTPHVGVMLNLGYSSMGINSATLNTIGVPGGGVHMFSATLDPIVHLNPNGHVDIYLTGGGGLFHRYQEFSQPSTATVIGFNPFFGFYPFQVGVTQVLASSSTNKPGVDGGIGFSVGTRWHGKFFGEARYARMFMNHDLHTDYLPVTFGFRW